MPNVIFSMPSILFVFEGTLDFTWGAHNDEPTIIANKIDMIAEQLDHAELPMLAAREIVIDDMKFRFDLEIDLEGQKWPPRAKSTIRSYKAMGDTYSTVLRKSDDLYNAVTSRSSYDVTDNDMFINTSSWPVYWHAQDQGSTVGKGVKLPQRQFVGVSEDAQSEIIDIFDEWMIGNIEIIRPGVTGVPMFRGAFGRIGGVAHRGPRRFVAPLVPGVRIEPTPDDPIISEP